MDTATLNSIGPWLYVAACVLPFVLYGLSYVVAHMLPVGEEEEPRSVWNERLERVMQPLDEALVETDVNLMFAKTTLMQLERTRPLL